MRTLNTIMIWFCRISINTRSTTIFPREISRSIDKSTTVTIRMNSHRARRTIRSITNILNRIIRCYIYINVTHASIKTTMCLRRTTISSTIFSFWCTFWHIFKQRIFATRKTPNILTPTIINCRNRSLFHLCSSFGYSSRAIRTLTSMN